MLKDFSPRPYQKAIFKTASEENTLVVLPTGMGKTAIAMMVAGRRKILYPSQKIVFLAPTKPLVEQQLESFKKYFDEDEDTFSLFTGSIAPAKRHKEWERAEFIFSTPQTIENDIMSGKIHLENVSLLVIDEAHRSVGNYAYVFIAQQYMQQAEHPRILALTASPGTDEEGIKTIINNLSIDTIEYREPNHKDLRSFSQETTMHWESVDLDATTNKILAYLRKARNDRIKEINEIKEIPLRANESKTQLIKLQAILQKRIAQGEATGEVYSTIRMIAEIIKIQHAEELAETQTFYALHEYLYNILIQARSGKSKSVQNLARDPNILGALALTREARKEKKEHPKFQKLIDHILILTQQQPQAKIIIFTQFRDTARHVEETLNKVIASKVFFGQAKKNGIGFSQKEQKKVLEEFRNGDFQCLIATSVAEEGLDIPSVDHVFFYEPIPSAIRSVQRRGRTGRHSRGYVTIFVAKNTRDEAYRWVAHHKEKRMYDVIKKLTTKTIEGLFERADKQEKLATFNGKQKTERRTPNNTQNKKSKPECDAQNKERRDGNQQPENRTAHTNTATRRQQPENREPNTANSSPLIVADFREKGSPVLQNLLKEDIQLQLKQLNVGDFLLSKECAVEFKNVKDFVDSIIDGRLLSQLRSLVQYPKPLLIIEGDQEEMYHRRINREAIQGMIATITTSYHIPLIRTFSPRETAQMLISIARREQDGKEKHFSYHNAKPLIDKDLQEYIVSSLPNIGGALAKALLEKFDSIEKLVKASTEELQSIPLIGKKKAEEIRRLITKSYKKSKEEFREDIMPKEE